MNTVTILFEHVLFAQFRVLLGFDASFYSISTRSFIVLTSSLISSILPLIFLKKVSSWLS